MLVSRGGPFPPSVFLELMGIFREGIRHLKTIDK